MLKIEFRYRKGIFRYKTINFKKFVCIPIRKPKKKKYTGDYYIKIRIVSGDVEENATPLFVIYFILQSMN